MALGIWGKKVGMTQLFAENKVIPVTVIDVSDWFVTQCKTKERDGYNAVQLGHVRSKYKGKPFSPEWLQNKKEYFTVVREIALGEVEPAYEIGSQLGLDGVLANGDNVDVAGVTIGKGFQGGVKRHGFSGGRASHGDKLGRKPGSLSGLRTQGRVFKNKRMPGHMGATTKTILNLPVVRVEADARILMVRGSIPGKSGSLVMVTKRG